MIYRNYMRLAALAGKVLSKSNFLRLEKIFIGLALISFLSHIGLIALQILGLVEIPGINNPNFLAAVATPFTFLLIYEIILFVASIGDSMLNSLGKQFQVVSLILIREVFKDVSNLSGLDVNGQESEILRAMALKIIVAVFIFAFTLAFYFIKNRLHEIDCEEEEYPLMMATEKLVAVVMLGVLIISTVAHTLIQINSGISLAESLYFTGFELNDLLITVFTAMIFADIFILTVYLLYNTSYQIIFRNAAFIIAGIFIRLGVTVETELDKLLLLGGTFLGLMVLLIYFLEAKISCRLNGTNKPIAIV